VRGFGYIRWAAWRRFRPDLRGYLFLRSETDRPRVLVLSTVAVDRSDGSASGGGLALGLRYGDLGLLVIALPVFLVAGWPIVGYVVAAAVWIAQRAIQLAADRRAARSLAAGDRRSALRFIAVTTLARVWLVALAILLVGLAEREAGLAAAVLTAGLVTLYLAGQFLSRLFAPEEAS
jgi:hypothetical protein